MKVLIIVGFIILFTSCGNQKGKENVKNSKQLKIGMSLIEMTKIMGDPDDIIKSYHDDSCKIYFYEPPFGASDGIDIYIDTNKMIIKNIVYYE